MTDTNGAEPARKRKRRWGEAAPTEDPKAKALALKESVATRLAALKAKKASGSSSTSVEQPVSQPPQQPPAAKKAKTFDLDLNVTGPTYQPQVPLLHSTKAAAKPSNPYLAHQEDPEEEVVQDVRLVRASKPRVHKKELHFVEPGTFVQLAEKKRRKAANALQSGFVSGRKTGTFVLSTGMDYYAKSTQDYAEEHVLQPRADCLDVHMPLIMEWWDTELLPSRLKKQVQEQEGKALTSRTKKQLQKPWSGEEEKGDEHEDDDETEKKELEHQELMELRSACFDQATLSYSKTAGLVQHIVPIGVNKEPEKQPTLYLTKTELKRQRKLRRAEKQRELQDMQAAGLVPAPEPKLTLSNFIKVLGDQAYLDPSQMEQKVMEQMQARQRAHLERNAANQLSKEQKAEKRARKLHEDTSQAVAVALFYVKDMSHPYHRTKVDLNAQQNNITGGVLECQNPPMACVICEGGPKAIKRYTRLMTVRMKWQGLEEEEEENDTAEAGEDAKPKQSFRSDNRCELVWTGWSPKRLFKNFVFQACETSDMARQVLGNKGVGHYWDQVLARASGGGETFLLKLVDDDSVEDDSDMVHDS
jgi:U4/U6 small nuclear ribonucleoprotein PRP3